MLPTISYQTPLGYPANESRIAIFQSPPLMKIRPMHPSNLQSRCLEMSITHNLERGRYQVQRRLKGFKILKKEQLSIWALLSSPQRQGKGKPCWQGTIKDTFPKTPSSALYGSADSRPLPAAQRLDPHPRGASRTANTR